MGEMFKIGEFAKLCGTSVKTLHFYDDIGLLRPAHVDKQTGYRFYAAEQLPRLARILTLKAWGFSLEEIGPLVQHPLAPDALVPLLRQKQFEIAARLQAEQERFHQITKTLRELEQTEADRRMTASRQIMQIRAVPEQTVAALVIRTPADAEAGQITALFQEGFATLYRTLGESHLWPTGSPLIYWKQFDLGETGQEGDAAACVPISPPKSDGFGESVAARAAGVTSLVLPPVAQMAYAVHHGLLAELPTLFQAIFNELQAQSLCICGPRRDVVLHYGGAPNATSTAPRPSVCEIQFPVSEVGKER